MILAYIVKIWLSWQRLLGLMQSEMSSLDGLTTKILCCK